MVTCTECKVAVVYFCNIFKTLLWTHFNINVDIIVKSVNQDMSVFARDGVEQVWSDSLGLPCSMHISRNLDYRPEGKRIRMKENFPIVTFHVRFLFRCRMLTMKNKFCKTFHNNWVNVRKEPGHTASMSKVYLSDSQWNGNWFFLSSGTPELSQIKI